ncbi:MAG: arylsulfatase [Chthoniobacteraceae bacterium]
MITKRIRTSALVAILLLGICGVVSAAGKDAPRGRPNIIFVLFDDMGWAQPQSYKADSALRTPNLDRLAQQGMRFTDAHSAAAVCTPTRYGVLTGRYPSRIGQFGVLTTFSKPIIPESRMTVASLLKQNGYTTASIGKWHLGMNWVDGKPGNEKEVPIGAKITDGPNAIGFDYFYGFTHARNIGTIIEQNRVVANVNAVENQPLMIKKAVEWIGQRRKDEPFFLYFPMCPPHEPLVPSPDYIGKSGAQDLVKKSAQYGDWLFQGDAMLGQLLEALDRHQLADNTLVIATSDNGAEQRTYEPLRESKRSIYEGGHRVPYVVRWPAKVKAGSVNDHTICLNDLLATAAEIVGAKLPANAGEDSVSLLGEFLGTAQTPAHEATVHQSSSGDLAIRQGPWKLVFLKSGRRELYNIDADLSEKKVVHAANHEVVAKLTTLMQGIIDRGRSAAGEAQKNDFALALPDGSGKAKRKKKADCDEVDR